MLLCYSIKYDQWSHEYRTATNPLNVRVALSLCVTKRFSDLVICLIAMKHDESIIETSWRGEWKIIDGNVTYIHVGTPCNPLPFSTNQTNVQSVIQNNLLRDIFLQYIFLLSANALKFP